VNPILRVKGRGFITNISNVNLAYSVSIRKSNLRYPLKIIKVGFITFYLYLVNIEGSRLLPVYL